jgi:hypothetical protein
MATDTPFAGLGLREKFLRLFGFGDLYDQLRAARSDSANAVANALELQVENHRLRSEAGGATESVQSLGAKYEELRNEASLLKRITADYDELKAKDQIIELEYPVNAKVRHGWGRPDQQILATIIGRRAEDYAEHLKRFSHLVEKAAKIERLTDDPTKPQWLNDWFPPFDAISLYGFLAERNPPKLVEIGSGTSTKFARQAISDHGLRTRIVSIDPMPRSEIDKICDKVVRSPLEDAPLDEFYSLTAEDILFFDGSHRSFQNSDVTVFFTEILPFLPPGLLVGIHDIFLPADYPPEWLKRFYSEQYLLACWLLAGEKLQIELPIWYCSANAELKNILEDLWGSPNLADCHISGGAFWFTIK